MKTRLSKKQLQELQRITSSHIPVTSGGTGTFQMPFGPDLTQGEKALGVFRMGLESLPLQGKTKEEILTEMESYLQIGIEDNWFTQETAQGLLVYLSVILERIFKQ
jgi:hypothetical protein